MGPLVWGFHGLLHWGVWVPGTFGGCCWDRFGDLPPVLGLPVGKDVVFEGVREGCYVGSRLFWYLARLTERLVKFGRRKIFVFPVLNPCRGDCHFQCMVACARIVIQKKEHLCS